MYSRQTRLFDTSLSSHLRERLDLVKVQVNRAKLEDLAAYDGSAPDIATPRLVRTDIEFEAFESGTKVNVQVTVPVIGTEELLAYKPDGGGGATPGLALHLRVQLTDDLDWMLDNGISGDSYHSRNWMGDGDEGRAVRGGFVFKKEFDGSTSGEVVRDWAKRVVDHVEELLERTEVQVEAFKASYGQAVSGWADSRRSALTTASALNEGLGRGL